MRILLAAMFSLWVSAVLAASPLPPIDPDNAIYEVKVEPGVSYDDMVDSLKSAAAGKNFVSPAHFPIGEHLKQRGLPLQGVMEIWTYCNLGMGAEILLDHPEFAVFAPCRIAVYERAGQMYLALDRPTYALRHIKQPTERARKSAQQLEEILIWMLDKARKGEI
jgi:uncharacterized protein (DUF302 family)